MLRVKVFKSVLTYWTKHLKDPLKSSFRFITYSYCMVEKEDHRDMWEIEFIQPNTKQVIVQQISINRKLKVFYSWDKIS